MDTSKYDESKDLKDALPGEVFLWLSSTKRLKKAD